MARVKAPANKKVLVWARETLGFDHEAVAHKIGTKAHIVKAWEEGEKSPSFNQLEDLSDLYRQPLITFFQEERPEEPQWPADFRKLSAGGTEPLKPETKIAIWDAQWRQSIAESLRSELDVNITFTPIGTKPLGDAEALAQQIRAKLGPSIEVQRKWARDFNHIFRYWRGLLEETGILVFRFDFPRDDVRAFSLPGQLAPIITVSSHDSRNGSIFSLFHELAHLLFRQSSTCNDFEFRKRAGSEKDRVEIFCNHFAGAFLVPADAILQHELVGNTVRKEINDAEIQQLAHYFGVSWEVILRRLLILERLDEAFYKAWKNSHQNTWNDPGTSGGGGGGDKYSYIRKILMRQGLAYIETVLSAYSEKIVSLTEASEYLGEKTQNVLLTQEFLYEGGAEL
ncbi:MAG: ImmA/IrrE family metallo-endopeptidase [bacterium]|nr:ImmA/IrrE family metallo-endopeptidase [bacterium]